MVKNTKLSKKAEKLLKEISKFPVLGPCSIPTPDIKEIMKVAEKIKVNLKKR